MTVIRSSVPIRTNALGIKVFADAACADDDCADGRALIPGNRNPISNPPLAATEIFKKSRRSNLRRIIAHLPLLPSRPPGVSLSESSDKFRNDKCCPSPLRQYLHRSVSVSRAVAPPHSSAVPTGSSRIGGRLLPATRAAGDG